MPSTPATWSPSSAKLAGMDEDDILAYANEQARRLWALL